MNLWCPWANRDILPNAGTFVGSEPFCGVLHTTEGVTYAGARAAYVKNNSAPQFTITYERQAVKLYQHAPLDRAGRALQNDPGGVQTNRRRCIQVEIVCFADQAKAVAYKGIYVADLPAAYLAGIASLMRWLEGETGIQPNYPTFKKYPSSYGTNNGVRFSSAQWRSFNGWCGHQHVPENDHGDPGEIPIALLFEPQPDPVLAPIAHRHEADMATTYDVMSDPLDAQGNGQHFTQYPFSKLMGTDACAYVRPYADGTYSPKGATVHPVEDAGKVLVVITDGVPNQRVRLLITVAD